MLAGACPEGLGSWGLGIIAAVPPEAGPNRLIFKSTGDLKRRGSL